MTPPIRLAKRLIQLTGCSRSQAERYIEGGWVSVNGCIVEQPQHPVTDETVTLSPEANLTAAGPISLVLNVAAHLNKAHTLSLLTAQNRWSEDATGIRQLQRHSQYLKPCIALSEGIEGMQILSQDWRIQAKAAEKLSQIEQEFTVDVTGHISAEDLQKLAKGLIYQGQKLPPCKISWLSEQRLRFALKNPLPGQIAHLCQRGGLQVERIKRIRLGATSLGKMPQGQWRYLNAPNLF